MSCDYQAIRHDNERRYGTDIGRIGPMLLANRYADRTHFIFELLQNAEDALARRIDWRGSRAVRFHLTGKMLRVSHFGLPFDERDVRGISGIAESTKDLTAIGRFGIGFKSVYAFTDRPEIHSGSEAFAIENYVWPVAVAETDRDPDETVISIPLELTGESKQDEIVRGLGKLNASVLLFLHEIEEIQWRVEGGDRMGHYLRESREIEEGIRKVTVIGQQRGQPDQAEEWLVISQAVQTENEKFAGHVELAFSVAREDDSQRDRIRRVGSSPLVVFFPTAVETHLGFLVQGPYRTTPSRDNVPDSDGWNRHLVNKTASLLRKALVWLRDNDLLDTAALQCLPLDPLRFPESCMFAPLYEATKSALLSDRLLPRFDTGYVAATCARLGRTQEIRELFTPAQLAALCAEEGQLVWLSGEITQDRTPEVRSYLMRELDVAELTPEAVIQRLDHEFLEAQPDDWVGKLYEFLDGQPGLWSRLKSLPLIRLEDGSQVPPRSDGHPQAFLPGPVDTSFPVVRKAVCVSERSLKFLQSLGLTQPNPVDDVVYNILPRYQRRKVVASDTDYEADIGRILNAYGTDSKEQRENLLDALRESAFVKTVDACDASKSFSKPGDVYLATERLRELFSEVAGVLLVDNAHACLRGEDIRELLEACGVTRYICPIRCDADLDWEQRREIRASAGCEDMAGEQPIQDQTLRGLESLLALLPHFDSESRLEKARLLWESLDELQERRGRSIFSTTYRWSYYQPRSSILDAGFVRKLNETAWVPDANGDLQYPSLVTFEALGWKSNPFLLSKICFKPPILDQLAKEAGIEPGVLDLLRNLGVTSEADLRERLGVQGEHDTQNGTSPSDVQNAVQNLLGGVTEPPTPPGVELSGVEPRPVGGREYSRNGSGTALTRRRTLGSVGGRPFVSYVGTHCDDQDSDPDGLDHPMRLALEKKAIELILSVEPEWLRTPTHNPGFDLYKIGLDKRPSQWCEVKAMTGSLTDRPVGLSRTQLDSARKHGHAYWLYVVERANSDDARIVRIRSPYDNARTFTFDHGWLEIAEMYPKQHTERSD
ncbi:MAG: DUF3883 domain-containing protein [Acidobacteriia bacterium]|nr:DUF3883 domain-containing protein [Terriglobia bacterium]